ncbi:small multi-drug export protein [Bacillus altitudinis]|uniref:small multi-drug export protein n=1 Tax=Bacillus altitudinis TaxID=293387 RepID=UPI0015BCC7DE|nr:small multi-drug export protein [Bacillus altitudinis]MCY7686990.1 small multi-drug export protein [Bacillus altitudinis]MCY7703231.1 small multi-drug export protein [Bacillus altitudinis]
MDIVWGYVLVFILAALPFFEVVGVVPLGILSGLHPVTTAVIGFVGNFLTVLLLIVFVDRFKAWWLKRKEEKHDEKGEKKQLKARKVWERYGLPGLALIGPFIIGSHLAAFMCMSFGTKRKQVTVWMTVSLIMWTALAASLTGVGFHYFAPDSNGLFGDIFSK